MQLGLSAASHSSLAPEPAAAHLLARVRAAAAAGLDSLTFGDQHVVAGDAYFQNTPTLGRALAEWTTRPAGCLFLLPLWHPVLVAEHVGTLAALHDGPFILQTGLGGGDAQFAGMGASLRTRAADFEEAVRVITALLDGESVSSERFGVTDARLGLRPERPVDWWVGAGAPAGLRRAARMGAAWYTSPGLGPDALPAPLATYREACAAEGTEPRVMARQDVTISTDPDVLDAARRHVDQGYRGMGLDQVVVATPDDAIERLAPFASVDVDQVVCRTMGVSTAADLETIEHLGTVATALRDL